jgi:hypothetical protein
MFRRLIQYVVLSMVFILIGPMASVAQTKETPNLGPGQAVQTTKPVICAEAHDLLQKFSQDPEEHLLIKYRDPVMETFGMIWYNKVDESIYVLEFPPTSDGTLLCIVVLGNDVRIEMPGSKL